MKHQQADILKKTSFCLILLFFGLMSASVTHAEPYTFVTKWGSGGAGPGLFSSPWGVAVDSSGNVYVADTSNERIQKFDNNGTYITQWGGGGPGAGTFYSPHGVAVDQLSGSVYVADTSNQFIQKFNSAGVYITQWGGGGASNGTFSNPHGVAVDSLGNVYVADTDNNRIQKFDSSGTFITKWGSLGAGDGQFSGPYAVAADSFGNVYVADTFNNRIQKFDSNGNYITQWGSFGTGDGQLYSPYGVAVDSLGNVYVADTSNNRIQKFDSNGAFIIKWGSLGSADGLFYNPHGVAVDPFCNVFVGDTDNQRIQKFAGSCQIRSLTIVKSASPATYFAVGQNITYTYTVTNSGNVNITGPINITDNKTGTFTISNIGLAPGHSITGTANYTITQDDLETCNDNATPINDSDHWDHSNDNATHEVPLESSTDLDNSDNLYGCDHSDDCDDCDHSNDNATPICSVTNAAFATGTFGNNTITSNTANATVTIIQCPECPHCPNYPDDCDDSDHPNDCNDSDHPDHPNYSIFKSVIGSDEDEECIVNSPGDKIPYRIVVKNEGNVNLTGISVEDSMISLTGPIGDDTDPEVLNPGEAWVYTGIYTLTSDDINNGKGHIDNTATVSSNELPDKSSSVSQPIEEKKDFNSNDSDELGDLDDSFIIVNTEPGLPIADGRESSHHSEGTGHAVVVSSSEVSSSTATETGIQPAAGNKTPLAVNDTQNKSDGSTVANVDQTAEKKDNTSTPAKESKSTPGFEIMCGMTAMLAVYLYTRK